MNDNIDQVVMDIIDENILLANALRKIAMLEGFNRQEITLKDTEGNEVRLFTVPLLSIQEFAQFILSLVETDRNL